MTDVEKYGLFALLFVVVILGLILASGGGGESPAAAAAEPGRPIVIRRANDVPRPAPRASANAPGSAERAAGTGAVRTYTVQSLVADRGPFHPDEPPVAYPGERSAALTAPSADGRVLHTVAKNETLSDISKIHFGTSTRWRDILALNPGLDPKAMQVGQVVVVQEAPRSLAPLAVAPPPVASPASAASAASGSREYVVKKGDTLGEIAQAQLGSSKRADELYEANRDVMKSKDALVPGMRLRLP